MNPSTKNFWCAATWCTGLIVFVVLFIASLGWANRYLTFEHRHDHVHPHEHPEHTHPEHVHVPEHNHPHDHTWAGDSQ